jgi:hypothetical protein
VLKIEALIQIGSILVAMTLAWAIVDARSQASERELHDHEARIRAIETQLSSTLGRIDVRLSNIEAFVRDQSK